MASVIFSFSQRLRQYWQGLAVRERRLALFTILFVACSVLWWVLLAPALRTIRTSNAQAAQQEAQLARMRSMQAQAAQLQQQPALDPAESQKKLMQLTQTMLGAESITMQGAQAVVQLNEVQPSVLSNWLAQARQQARAVPAQAQIEQSATGWNGQIVMRLP